MNEITDPMITARPDLDRIVAVLEQHFGARVRRLRAPGGKTRASLRAEFDGRSVIVTHRPLTRLARTEARVMKSLAPLSDDLPRYLGYREGLLFQSDVGSLRLGHAASEADPAGRIDLATRAVAAIFRLHRAARQTDLHLHVPHLGASRDWVADLVDGPADLARRTGTTAPALKTETLIDALCQPAVQFMKWDCRSGNGALDGEGRVRWYDFEFCGMRHGAEEFAWLIGDEVWAVAVEDMMRIVADAFDPAAGRSRDDYLRYLALYTVFHVVQRLIMVVNEVRRRGWSPEAKAIRLDQIGTHPACGLRLCEVGRFCADVDAMTRPCVALFDTLAKQFRDRMPHETARKNA